MGFVDRSSSNAHDPARVVLPGGRTHRGISPYVDYSGYSFYPPHEQGLRHDERLELARRRVRLTTDISGLDELKDAIMDIRPTREAIVRLLVRRFGEDRAARLVDIRQLGYVAESHLQLALTELARTRPHLHLDPNPIPPRSRFEGFDIVNQGGSITATNRIATQAEYDAIILLGGTPVIFECKSRPYNNRGLRELDTAFTHPRDYHKIRLMQGVFGEVSIGFGMMIPDTVSDRAAESIRRVERKGAFVCPFPVGHYREMFGVG